MSHKDNQKPYNNHAADSRSGHTMAEDNFDPSFMKYNGFSSYREMVFASIHNYLGNCKTMLKSSLSHLRAPSTIIVIVFLVALYIILGVAGIVDFKFSINENIREMRINLDIIVNALLGFFYGPVTSAVSVTLCCLARMAVTPEDDYFIGYVILSAIAGFLHGWILYRHKVTWFGTRFRGFYTDLLAKAIVTRLVVSIVVNVLLMGLIYYISFRYPIYEYILHYKYSDVELKSFMEFIQVFVAGFLVDTIVVFMSLSIVNFLASKAFPVQYAQMDLLFEENDTAFIEEDFSNDKKSSHH